MGVCVCVGECVRERERECTHVRNKERNQDTKRSEIEVKLETGKQSVYERKNER